MTIRTETKTTIDTGDPNQPLTMGELRKALRSLRNIPSSATLNVYRGSSWCNKPSKLTIEH
jgi:hypothetical protein